MATGSDSLELPRCRVCGVPVMPQSGVAFRAGARILFVTCQKHATLVGEGAQLVQRIATKGLRELMEDKAPNLFGALKEVWTEHRRIKEQNG